MSEAKITPAMAPAWSRCLSADEYDDSDEDDRTRRKGRHRVVPRVGRR